MTDVENRRTRGGLVSGIMSVSALVFGALALWSALNPGFYYLYRFGLFTLLGASATYIAAKPLTSRQAPTLALLFVAALLTIAIIVEEITAPANQVESVTLILVPLVLLTTAAATVTWLLRRR